MVFVINNKQTSETTVMPVSLPGQLLRQAHDELRHNGSQELICS